jgi:hypothetical protein
MPILLSLFSNWKLVAAGVAALVVVGFLAYVSWLSSSLDDERARSAVLRGAVEQADAVNRDNLVELDRIKAENERNAAAVANATRRAASRAKDIEKLKRDLENVKTSDCAVDPRVRAALDGLRGNAAKPDENSDGARSRSR